MPDVRVGVMLLLCGASENELVSHHKNIQEGTSIWNLSAPRSCYAGSNRQSEETGGWGGGGGGCMYWSRWVCEFGLVHEHMVFSVFFS